jgi:cytochrome c peroxidase
MVVVPIAAVTLSRLCREEKLKMATRSRWSVRSIALVTISLGLTGFFVGLVLAQSQTRSAKAEGRKLALPPLPEPPPAFDEVPVPEDNPMSPEKVALGRRLFFDKSLSGDGSRSCYSCHVCESGLTDGLPTAIGAHNKQLSRSSPTLWNIGYHSEFYWDGRAGSLEKQGMAAWKGGNMGADPEKIVPEINAKPSYKMQFNNVFGSDASPDNVIKAISAYERTLFCGSTRYDRHEQGEEDALTPAEKRGWELFRGKASCGTCHAGILFTDMLFHNTGIGMDKAKPDIGRKKVTKKEEDTGAFKTPTLRDISKSGPYFHDGSVATLASAVEIMATGGKPNQWLDTKNLQDRKLTQTEKDDIVAFLKSLDCECNLRAERKRRQ